MMDVAIVVFTVRALVMAGRRAWWAGVACALLGLMTWAALAGAGWRGHGAEQWEASGVWMLFLLGPSGVAAPSSGASLVDAIGSHSLVVRSMVGGVAWLGFVLGNQRADRHSPLSEEASRWSQAALAFLPSALLVGLEVVLFALGSLLSREG